MPRGKIGTDTLVKIILVLVILWLALEVLDALIGLFFGPFSGVIGIVIVLLLVLWYFDYI